MAERSIQYLSLLQAVANLSQYYGLYTIRDLTSTVAGLNFGNRPSTQIAGTTIAERASLTALPAISEMLEILIDTSTGGKTSANIIKRLSDTATAGRGQEASRQNFDQIFGQKIKIFYKNATELSSLLNESFPAFLARESITQIIGTETNPTNIINTSAQCSKANPGMSLIKIDTTRVTPNQKNINAVSLFWNCIPSTELARATPFIDIKFLLARSPFDNTSNQIRTISISKFLLGAQDEVPFADRIMLDGSTTVSTNQTANGNESNTVSISGMELFTSPQTMVDGDYVNPQIEGTESAYRQAEELRINPIKDKFRPFMSIVDDITIEVIPNGGAMSYRKGKLSLVLHDSSRLTEVTDLVSPDLYSKTELLLEYGWQHPDSPQIGNVFADLINGMRQKEKYKIIQSQYAFTETGQVKIDMDISAFGVSDTFTENIASSESSVQESQRNVVELGRTIRELSTAVNNIGGVTRTTESTEARGIQIFTAASDTADVIEITAPAIQEFRRFQTSVSRLPNNATRARLDSLIRAVQQAIDKRAELKRNVKIEMDKKIAVLTNPQAVDPLLSVVERQLQASTIRSQGGRKARCSLGKLILLFVGQPLAATHKFDDIQFLFYPFNDHAGRAREKNIAEFSVDIEFFKQQYERLRTQSISRAANLSVNDFIRFLTGIILDDPSAEDYGMVGPNGVYVKRAQQRNRAGVTEETQPTFTTRQRNQTEIATNTAIERLMINAGIIDGVFKMPQVDFYIETLAEEHDSTESTSTLVETDVLGREVRANEKTILRIHIFDRQSSAYETQGALLAAIRDQNLVRIGNLSSQVNNRDVLPTPSAPATPGGRTARPTGQTISNVSLNHREVNTQIIDLATAQEGLIEQISDPSGITNNTSPNVYRIRGGPRGVREFVMKTTPTLIYGAEGSGIKSAALSSMQVPELLTINMMRNPAGNSSRPNGERPNGLPMQVIPAQLQAECLGCPLVEFMQMFFFDFNTTTSVDNIYSVTGFTHTIGPGKFNTSLKLTPNDAYGKYVSFSTQIETAVRALNQTAQSRNVESLNRPLPPTPRRRRSS